MSLDLNKLQRLPEARQRMRDNDTESTYSDAFTLKDTFRSSHENIRGTIRETEPGEFLLPKSLRIDVENKAQRHGSVR